MTVGARTQINIAQVAALLAGGPFAAALARGDALIVAEGDPAQAIFATPAALRQAGAQGLADLDALYFRAQCPGAARLRHLARNLPLNCAPRLELLRFFADRQPVTMSALCVRLGERADEAQFVLVALESAGLVARPIIAPTRKVESPRPSTAAPGTAVRFLWSLDRDGRFGPSDAALDARLGANAPRLAETLDSLRARVGVDAANLWSQALAVGKTFTGLRIEWPMPGKGLAHVAFISGAPYVDRERQFAGLRGFGVFSGETVEVVEAPTPLAVGSAPEPSLGADRLIAAPQTMQNSQSPEDVRNEVVAKGAEIVVLRPGLAPPANSPNVVPIRPTALGVLANPPSEPESPRDGRAVELSSQERDAFREIARALGVKSRNPRAEARDPTLPPTDRRSEAKQSGVVERAGSNSPPEAHDLAALLDALPTGALVLQDGEPRYLNRTLLDLLGFESLASFRDADGLNAAFRGRDPSVLAPENSDQGITMVASSGELILVDAQARAIRWEGEPATLLAVRRAYEAEHQAEIRALRRAGEIQAASARDFAAALDVAADGMVRLDALGHILGLSSRAEALFGYDQKEVAGESFLMLLAPASQGEATALLDRVAREETRASRDESVELMARDREGRTFPIRLAFGRLASGDRRDFGALFRDLTRESTERRELESARDAAEKASVRKTEFLASVSHEIRTPLHAILGFAEVIMEERFGPIENERYKDYVKDIHASGQHVVSLANDLLDLSKIEAGKMELEFAPVDANRIIRECVILMQPQAARERIIVRLSLYDKLPNVMADERSLRQIVLNLMSNAVKYNEPGGQVIVSTALDEANHAVIRVRDTGVGMNENELSLAMERFQRLPGVRRDEGSGLGLPLTKALVEANHADFSIKSRKDHGTLVEVVFPGAIAAQ